MKTEKSEHCFFIKCFAALKLLLFLQSFFTGGDVAQLVEQRTENPCVTGSIPVVATESTSDDVLFFMRNFNK